MKSLFTALVLKILSVLGAMLNTVGFLSFFFWQSLAPYRWQMILGGLALIAISKFLFYLLSKRLKAETR